MWLYCCRLDRRLCRRHCRCPVGRCSRRASTLALWTRRVFLLIFATLGCAGLPRRAHHILWERLVASQATRTGASHAVGGTAHVSSSVGTCHGGSAGHGVATANTTRTWPSRPRCGGSNAHPKVVATSHVIAQGHQPPEGSSVTRGCAGPEAY